MPDETTGETYSARTAYGEYSSASGYEERPFYRGPLGWYRKQLERSAIRALTGASEKGSSFVDCPCGNGRWFETLARRAKKIVAVDVSPGMLHFARDRAECLPHEIEFHQASAEELPLEDGSVDYVFSYALMKHLPVPVQYRVLAEFARVSRRGVVCSFGMLTSLSYAFWRRRNIAESYPVFREEIGWMARDAGLVIETVRRCSTPIGLERLVRFERG
jgi:ubiquinone/menaquinone biosynthesis C-methylase UbiE